MITTINRGDYLPYTYRCFVCSRSFRLGPKIKKKLSNKIQEIIQKPCMICLKINIS